MFPHLAEKPMIFHRNDRLLMNTCKTRTFSCISPHSLKKKSKSMLPSHLPLTTSPPQPPFNTHPSHFPSTPLPFNTLPQEPPSTTPFNNLPPQRLSTTPSRTSLYNHPPLLPSSLALPFLIWVGAWARATCFSCCKFSYGWNSRSRSLGFGYWSIAFFLQPSKGTQRASAERPAA